jgi:FkbM family methyltransferase
MFPLYSDNLGRVAAHLSAKYDAFPVIDIGANIGDTAAILHRYVHSPILCIEGEPKFAEFLAVNVASRNPVPVIERSFVGAGNGDFEIFVLNGTARLAPAAARWIEAIRTRTFEAILEEHATFQSARLLKIDADGMDLAILDSAYDWIARRKPVLFFEYDPDLQRAYGDNGLQTFQRLRGAGYHRMLVYENTGDFMFSAEIGNETLLDELCAFFSGRRSQRYCDLCVFHREDEDLAETIRRAELEFFRAARPYLPPVV